MLRLSDSLDSQQPHPPRPTREWWVLAIFLLVFPVVAYVSTLPAKRFRNEITQWGNRSSETYLQFKEYQKEFGVNEQFAITWPGCNLGDPRVEQVTEQIEQQLSEDVKQVTSGQRVYRDLLSRGGLSRELAIKRLRNVAIGEDDFSTAVGFNLRQHASYHRGEVVERLDEILRSNGVDPDEAAFAGLGHNLYMLDLEGLESPFRMVPQIMLLALVLTTVLVKNLRLAFLINLLGAFTGCLSFNFIWAAGVNMNAIIWPLPTLTMLLTVSASLHFLSYFENAKRDFVLSKYNGPVSPASIQWSLADRRTVARTALKHAMPAALCCTLTTALGLLSLVLSSSGPVRQFGLFGAISIVSANALLLLVMPCFLVLTKTKVSRAIKREQANSGGGWENRIWDSLVWFACRFRMPIILASLTLMAVLATGLPKIKTGTNLQNFFPAGHRELTDAEKVEVAVGPLNSVELLLEFDNVNERNDRLRMRAIQAMCDRVINETAFESCVSPATFAPEFRRKRNAIQQAAELSRLRGVKKEMIKMGLVSVTPNSSKEIWRVSCRYSTDHQIVIPSAQQQLKAIADKIFFRDGDLILQGETMSVISTGEFVLFDLIDRHFYRELILTYVFAFVVISLVVMLVLRTPLALLIALPPNLFPAIVVLGGTGYLGFSLDAASLMTASVALGIAVDDTLHFMLWWEKVRCANASGLTKSNVDAIKSAMRNCGKAIFQTSFVLGCSMVLYGLCGFLPTVRFGLLLTAMMFVALVGDLILLPALLSGTKLFRKVECLPDDGQQVEVPLQKPLKAIAG